MRMRAGLECAIGSGRREEARRMRELIAEIPEAEPEPMKQREVNVGRLGELQVEERLVENGWHPIRFDTAQMASNADLLAVNSRQRVFIQVKTTNGNDHSHAHALMFGNAGSFLRD